MNKIIYTILILCSINFLGFSQEVTSNHKIERVGNTNEYNITTTITGLQGVDIARINYMLSDKYTYKSSPKNTFFSDRNAEHIKFYIMGIPNDGKIVIYLGIITNTLTKPLSIPVEFQYSRNEEKQTLKLPPIVLGEDLMAENTTTSLNETPLDVSDKVDETTVNNEVSSNSTEKEIIPKKPVEAIVTTASNLPEEEKTTKKEAPSEEIITPKNIIKTNAVKTSTSPKEEKNYATNTINQSDAESKTPVTTTRTPQKFTVQILALSQFSQNKLNIFCKQHNLLLTQISKKQINGLMKIRYGVANNKEEAKKLRTSLLNKGIIGAFIVTTE